MPRDILILGGGPAGISTALHLLQHDPQFAARILVLEKARYPRHKLCGGGLTPDAEVILQGLGLDVVEIPHVDAAEAHLDYRGAGLVIRFRGRHALRMIRRDEFDAWLAAKARLAGVEIREGVTARRVMPGQDVVTVETDAGVFEAAIVVGADGSNGVTRRCILPDAPIHTARALEVLVPAENVIARERSDRSNPPSQSWASTPSFSAAPDSVLLPSGSAAYTDFPRSSEKGYVSGVLPDPYPFSDPIPLPRTWGRGKGWGKIDPHAHASNVAYFDFAPVPLGIAGYTWDFPTQVNGEPMRCWGIYDTNLLAAASRTPLKRALEQELLRHGGSLHDVEVQGHPIRWFSPRSALSVPRVLLVGDAAGADGIFGEGISIALGSGRVAAEAILDALERRDLSFRDYRRRVLMSPLGQALIVRTAVTHVLYRMHWAWFQSFFWRIFKPVVKAVSLLIVLNWARRMKPAKIASLAKQ